MPLTHALSLGDSRVSCSLPKMKIAVENCLARGDTLRISAKSLRRWKLESLVPPFGKQHMTVSLFIEIIPQRSGIHRISAWEGSRRLVRWGVAREPLPKFFLVFLVENTVFWRISGTTKIFATSMGGSNPPYPLIPLGTPLPQMCRTDRKTDMIILIVMLNRADTR